MTARAQVTVGRLAWKLARELAKLGLAVALVLAALFVWSYGAGVIVRVILAGWRMAWQ